MKCLALVSTVAALAICSAAHASFIVYEGTGSSVAAITPIRDAFRTGVGGGVVAGANGSFGGLRREINWDGVPDAFADPNQLPGNFFNTTSPRGVVLSTPGTGFLVSANAGGGTPVLFGFSNDFQAFSPQRLFTAVSSDITDVSFFVPGTTTAAVTTAFGLIFVDVEVAGSTRIDFFDASNALIFTRNALVAGNQGLSFVGGMATAGEKIARVRITSGTNTIVSNGVLGNTTDDVVVMDDFIYAEPVARVQAVPEPPLTALLAIGILGGLARCRRPGPSRGR